MKPCDDCVIEVLDIIVKEGFFRIGDTTYVLEAYEYPHDERCNGTMMCYCRINARKENPEKYNNWLEKQK